VNAALVAFDLGGTFVFALSGAAAGIKNRFPAPVKRWPYTPDRLRRRCSACLPESVAA
jgi:hypothetical protein